MQSIVLSEAEFAKFQRFIFDAAGITMGPAKMALVSSRLAKRLAVHGLDSYGAYFKLLSDGENPAEVQMAVDLLTTNETYFFREAQHFEVLRTLAVQARTEARPLRVWSAASSSGEEAYSAAMVMADAMGTTAWEVLGTDISQRMVEAAQRGLFSLERGRHIPKNYLQRFCLKGTGAYEGMLLVDRSLRARVAFRRANLNDDLPELGQFDLVFLRNVMIYFNQDTKRRVVARVLDRLKPGGLLCIGHSESLNDLATGVRLVTAATYRKES